MDVCKLRAVSCVRAYIYMQIAFLWVYLRVPKQPSPQALKWAFPCKEFESSD